MKRITLGGQIDELLHPLVKREQIEKGRIVKLTLTIEDGLVLKGDKKTHEKRFVIIGFTPDNKAIGANLINTNPNLISEEIEHCQIPLKMSDYPQSLTHDSWLDCSEIFEIDIDRITSYGRDHGTLTDSDRELVFDFLKETDVISNEDKSYYGLV